MLKLEQLISLPLDTQKEIMDMQSMVLLWDEDVYAPIYLGIKTELKKLQSQLNDLHAEITEEEIENVDTHVKEKVYNTRKFKQVFDMKMEFIDKAKKIGETLQYYESIVKPSAKKSDKKVGSLAEKFAIEPK